MLCLESVKEYIKINIANGFKLIMEDWKTEYSILHVCFPEKKYALKTNTCENPLSVIPCYILKFKNFATKIRNPSEVYLEPSQRSMMKFYWENS